MAETRRGDYSALAERLRAWVAYWRDEPGLLPVPSGPNATLTVEEAVDALEEKDEFPQMLRDREGDIVRLRAMYNEAFEKMTHAMAEQQRTLYNLEALRSETVPTITKVELVGHPGEAVSARCILSGCQDFSTQPCVVVPPEELVAIARTLVVDNDPIGQNEVFMLAREILRIYERPDGK